MRAAHIVDERQASAEAAAVVTKAVVRAAERLGLSGRELAAVLGVSEATVSRMKRGRHLLRPGEKAFELAVLFIRMFRSLDAITGGDEAVARAWLRNTNNVLGAPPAENIRSIGGLVDVIAYLDGRRAPV
ncbi:MAG: hypothetical protein KatS3mg119_0296 [Rhodothalassiaceae bacterium]|nr:MAG: hypothetical protein KatS3mg119_0296 [Rhodothalassiaceae bacterium]